MNKLTGINVARKIEKVKHSDLTRMDNSQFRSICPFCREGILLVQRDPNTLQLVKEDHCLLCGQRVIYSDIKKVKDWGDK